MSHPENTLKEIVQRQNKKIEGLENLIYKMICMYQLMSVVDSQENRNGLLDKLDKVRKL
jgi:hypothetical protein